jgi:hypothetical protein
MCVCVRVCMRVYVRVCVCVGVCMHACNGCVVVRGMRIHGSRRALRPQRAHMSMHRMKLTNPPPPSVPAMCVCVCVSARARYACASVSCVCVCVCVCVCAAVAESLAMTKRLQKEVDRLAGLQVRHAHDAHLQLYHGSPLARRACTRLCTCTCTPGLRD